jgi:hypothetical protein
MAAIATISSTARGELDQLRTLIIQAIPRSRSVSKSFYSIAPLNALKRQWILFPLQIGRQEFNAHKFASNQGP